MSDYRDNGFKSAQRAYDNQEPPDNSTYIVDCSNCGGGGVNIEGDICKRCDGDGSIAISEREYKRLMKEAKVEDETPTNDEL